jgi:hypothetical protein
MLELFAYPGTAAAKLRLRMVRLPSSPVNLKAISAAERPLHNDWMQCLRASVRERTEGPDG